LSPRTNLLRFIASYRSLTFFRVAILPFMFVTLSIAVLISGCEQKSSRLGRALNSNELRGKKLFVSNCQKCHQPENGLATQGPALEGLFDKQFMPSGTPANDERAQNVIQYGRRQMPAFGQVLDDSQVRDIIAYLHTQ
jgi:mono/diheme cytochrome c family protein